MTSRNWHPGPFLASRGTFPENEFLRLDCFPRKQTLFRLCQRRFLCLGADVVIFFLGVNASGSCVLWSISLVPVYCTKRSDVNTFFVFFVARPRETAIHNNIRRAHVYPPLQTKFVTPHSTPRPRRPIVESTFLRSSRIVCTYKHRNMAR